MLKEYHSALCLARWHSCCCHHLPGYSLPLLSQTHWRQASLLQLSSTFVRFVPLLMASTELWSFPLWVKDQAWLAGGCSNMPRASCNSRSVCGAGHLPSSGEPAIGSSQRQSSLLKSRLSLDFHRRNNVFRKKRCLKNYQLWTSLHTAGSLSKAGLLQTCLCLR